MTRQTAADPRAQRADRVPETLRSAQPGGGVCYQIELAWGRLRRWYLRHVRPGYVRRMARLRVGDPRGAPHALIDSRDLKYCCTCCDVRWPSPADRFRWRDRLPFARWGLAELLLLGFPLLTATIGVAWLPGAARFIALVPAVLLALIVYFFRDPPRHVPTGDGLLVAPADGAVVEVAPVDDDPFLGGPAVRIGIFLSIFNVHINRAPAPCRVVRLAYQPGRFLNALRPESARENEAMWIGLEADRPPRRRLVVRQISGTIARRIVCALRPGQRLARGERFGMIKLGSRTELIVPADGLIVDVDVGAKVKAGNTVLARWQSTTSASV